MTKIKICGLTRADDIIAVNRFMPDYIGFVFAKSRRQVTYEQAVLLKDNLNPKIKAVGVFVDEPLPNIIKLIKDGVIDIVQLHGEEDEAYIKKLRQESNGPIIKAVRVQSAEQILKAEKLPCDMLLLDSYQKDQQGGSGKGFDVSLIPPLKKPFFLAGGLNNENIESMINKCRPFAVDISSGVETNGIKDEKKIEQIIKTINEINKK
ncbi:MAG: phosphoribosylanthranilate isomerase [Bacillota bacterium]|nr:phosphoribosylanthranilate isomerase [Bacillota bacterium]